MGRDGATPFATGKLLEQLRYQPCPKGFCSAGDVYTLNCSDSSVALLELPLTYKVPLSEVSSEHMPQASVGGAEGGGEPDQGLPSALTP